MTAGASKLRVFMMDLWCIVPYYTVYLCKALRNQDVDVTLASISYHWDLGCFTRQGVRNDPGLLDIVATLGLRNRRMRQVLKLVEACINMSALAVRLAVSKPDLIHVQFIPLLEFGIPVEVWFLRYAKRFGIKVVYTVHNELPLDTGERYLNAYRSAYHVSDRLICHTQEAKEGLSQRFGIAPERIEVIAHGPIFHDLGAPSSEDARGKLGLAPDERVVLCQGWIKPYKGVPFLLDAWEAVQRQNPKARLIIAGTGDEKLQREIRDKVAALKIDGSVRLELRFLDSVAELPLYYATADIAVYPYKEITTSGALMTGLAYGKAIVATKLAAFQDVIEDGRSALLVPYGDKKALTCALLTLMGDPDLRARLGANAALLATKLSNSWQAIAERTQACYGNLVAPAMTPEHATIAGR